MKDLSLVIPLLDSEHALTIRRALDALDNRTFKGEDISPALPCLIRIVETGKPALRYAALGLIDLMMDEGTDISSAHPVIEASLKDPVLLIRCRAAEITACLAVRKKDPDALQSLLSHRSFRMRGRTANLIAVRTVEGANLDFMLDLIKQKTHDPSPDVRSSTAFTLVFYALNRKRFSEIIEMLRSTDPSFQEGAARAMESWACKSNRIESLNDRATQLEALAGSLKSSSLRLPARIRAFTALSSALQASAAKKAGLAKEGDGELLAGETISSQKNPARGTCESAIGCSGKKCAGPSRDRFKKNLGSLARY